MDVVTLVSAARTALGLSTFLAPGPALRPVGIAASTDDQLAYLSRIAGSRDVALGVLALTMAFWRLRSDPTPEVRRRQQRDRERRGF